MTPLQDGTVAPVQEESAAAPFQDTSVTPEFSPESLPPQQNAPTTLAVETFDQVRVTPQGADVPPADFPPQSDAVPVVETSTLAEQQGAPVDFTQPARAAGM